MNVNEEVLTDVNESMSEWMWGNEGEWMNKWIWMSVNR